MIRLSTSGHVPFPSGSALVFGARKTSGAIWPSRPDQVGRSLLVTTASSSNAAEKCKIRVVRDQMRQVHWIGFSGSLSFRGLWLVACPFFQALSECLIHFLVDRILNISMTSGVKVVLI